MSEITLNGFSYRIGRLNAVKQFHVMRRIMPVLAASGPALSAVVAGLDTTGTTDLSKMFSALGPVASAIGDLSDEASNFVLGTCLGVVTTNRVGSTWAPVASPQGALMFDDLPLAVVLKLVLLVLQENLGSFLADLGGGSSDGQ